MASLSSAAPAGVVTTTVPLTTIFTPRQGCHFTGAPTWQVKLTTSAHGGAKPTIFASPQLDKDCYPKSYGTKGQRVLYSPGVCPSGYYAAIPSGKPNPATSYCCPSGAAFPYQIGSPSYCYSTITEAFIDVPGANGPFSTSQLVIQSGLTNVGLTVAIGIAEPLTVTWQSSDLAQFTPASAPLNDVATSRYVQEGTAVPTQTGYVSGSSSSKPSSGLSTGAQAGIGVGVAVGALILLGAFLWWFLRHRRAKRRAAESPAEAPGADEPVVAEKDASMPTKAELGQEGAVNEMDGKSHATELHPYDKPVEVDSAVRYEVEGDSVPKAAVEKEA